jgi:hypothetical protein
LYVEKHYCSFAYSAYAFALNPAIVTVAQACPPLGCDVVFLLMVCGSSRSTPNNCRNLSLAKTTWAAAVDHQGVMTIWPKHQHYEENTKG